MKNKYLIAGLIALGLGISGYAFAQVASGQLSACVSKDGEARFIVTGFTKKQSCEKGDHLVIWNIIGEQGPKGDPGTSFAGRLVGSNEQDFGLLVSLLPEPNRQKFGYVSYLESQDVFLNFSGGVNSTELLPITSPPVYFESNDCTGEGYLSQDIPMQGIFLIPASTQFYSAGAAAGQKFPNSLKESNSDSCFVYTVPGGLPSAYSIRQVTIPDFPSNITLRVVY